MRYPLREMSEYLNILRLSARTAAALPGGQHARFAADCRARIDVVSTLQGGCFSRDPAQRAAAGRELVEVLSLDAGEAAETAAIAVELWAQALTTPPASGAVDQLRAAWGAQ